MVVKSEESTTLSTSIPQLKLLQSEKVKPLSPYFNFDADLLDDNPALPTIVPRQRGRLERAFPLIGASFLVGFVTGGLAGIVEGIGSTRFMDGRIRRSHIINHFLKRSRSAGTAMGTIALLYCSLGALCQLARRGQDDLWNNAAAGASTGMLLKSAQGLRKCVMGGGVGLAVGSLHVFIVVPNQFNLNFN